MQFPCTRCGALVSSIEEMKVRCPTPGEPYASMKNLDPPAGHSLPVDAYMKLLMVGTGAPIPADAETARSGDSPPSG